MRLTIACLLVVCAAGTRDLPSNYVAGTVIELKDNGAWSWFMDERAIVDDGQLIVGSVRAVGDYRNDRAPDWGNVEVSVYDLASGATRHTVLHRHLQQDDHASPAFLALPDGRYLAVYTQHGVERRIYYAVSEPHNPLKWGPASTFDTPGSPAQPRRGKRSEITDVEINALDLSIVFQGVPADVAWMSDLELDAQQRPYVVFSVQKDGRGLPRGQGGFDRRFDYGRWDGSAWRVHEIAYAGTRLYAGEDDYTGLASLDPNDPDVVYISTDADPVTGTALVSRADDRRHHELFRGTTRDSGATWRWEPITANSTMDNLRPVVPRWKDPRTALVWMRGTYKNNHGEWTTAVVAMILPPAPAR